MFDTHCHLSFPEFRHRVGEVLAAARKDGVLGAVTVATTSGDAERSLELARSHPDLWCTAGVHPLHSDEAVDWEAIRRCGEDPKCVAWGELGLDRHYPNPPQATQRRILDEQLARIVAWRDEGLEKPVVIHCRDAFAELLPILEATGLPRDRFVFHCFTGSLDDARAVIDFGAWISFTGVVTFRNARSVAEAARIAPAERILVETDSPFLSPEPVRTVRPNEPRFVAHVGRRIAALRGESEDACAARLDANAERFFGIAIRR